MKTNCTKIELLLLRVDQLLTHPKNMRKFYPKEQVREMANSIQAHNGVLEPLIVVKNSKQNKWLVVDGNMRLAGARLLGNECPDLECKLVEETEAEQLLAMVTANQVRYDVDPVSEGIHYKHLMDDGFTMREIAKKTGVYAERIRSRQILARLEEPIQKLIINNKFPCSFNVAQALLSLPSDIRLRLVDKFGSNPNVKVDTILNACAKLREGNRKEKRLKHPAKELSGADRVKSADLSWKKTRDAVRSVCEACSQYEGELRAIAEPAWALLVHAADENCGECPLNDAQRICKGCPTVALLKKLVPAKAKEMSDAA